MSFICLGLYTGVVQRDQDATDSSDLCLPSAVIGEFRQKIISHYSLLSFGKTAAGKKSGKSRMDKAMRRSWLRDEEKRNASQREKHVDTALPGSQSQVERDKHSVMIAV